MLATRSVGLSESGMIGALLLVACLLPRTVYTRNECYLVYGRLVCEGRPDSVANLVVDLKDDDGVGIDDHIGRTQTSENGSFSVTGCGYDPLPFNAPDPYLRIIHTCDRASNYTKLRKLEMAIFPVSLPKLQNIGKIFLDEE
uniref:Transthyretin-like family protein n=1 Tax=Steinernema glaseri TaxID=37863 RepID=A0A1I8ACW7_9BILA